MGGAYTYFQVCSFNSARVLWSFVWLCFTALNVCFSNANEISKWVQVLATKPGDLILSSETFVEEE